MKMRNVLLIIFILITLTACAQKPISQPLSTQPIPSFPNPSPAVLAKLTDLNDYEVNAWLIKISLYKKEIEKLK